MNQQLTVQTNFGALLKSYYGNMIFKPQIILLQIFIILLLMICPNIWTTFSLVNWNLGKQTHEWGAVVRDDNIYGMYFV